MDESYRYIESLDLTIMQEKLKKIVVLGVVSVVNVYILPSYFYFYVLSLSLLLLFCFVCFVVVVFCFCFCFLFFVFCFFFLGGGGGGQWRTLITHGVEMRRSELTTSTAASLHTRLFMQLILNPEDLNRVNITAELTLKPTRVLHDHASAAMLYELRYEWMGAFHWNKRNSGVKKMKNRTGFSKQKRKRKRKWLKQNSPRSRYSITQMVVQ